jgi:hypothetical protein
MAEYLKLYQNCKFREIGEIARQRALEIIIHFLRTEDGGEKN